MLSGLTYSIINKNNEKCTKYSKLAVQVEKRNCNRLHSRSKRIEIKHMIFRYFGY